MTADFSRFGKERGGIFSGKALGTPLCCRRLVSSIMIPCVRHKYSIPNNMLTYSVNRSISHYLALQRQVCTIQSRSLVYKAFDVKPT